MAYEEVSLQPSRVLAAVVENLNRFFYEAKRDEAKQHFQKLDESKHLPFMKIDAGEGREIFLELSLDKSEYLGTLNFGQFRKHLAMMMLGVKNKLDGEEEIHHLSSEQGDMLFNIPGIVKGKQETNVLVCALKPMGPGLLNLQLMFLDPIKYQTAAHA